MASGATPPASPQDSFSAWAAPDNEQRRTSGAPGVTGAAAAAFLVAGQAPQLPAHRYRERRLEPPQAADLQ